MLVSVSECKWSLVSVREEFKKYPLKLWLFSNWEGGGGGKGGGHPPLGAKFSVF